VSDSDDEVGGNTPDEFSLESILAEYKGSAFINGDKKTPPELLNEQAERILREAAKSLAPDSLLSKISVAGRESAEAPPKPATPKTDGGPPPSRPTTGRAAAEAPPKPATPKTDGGPPPSRPTTGRAAADAPPKPATPKTDAAPPPSRPTTGRAAAEEPPRPAAPKTAAGQSAQKDQESDNVILFFDNFRNPPADLQETIVRNVEKAAAREIGKQEELKETERKLFTSFERYEAAGAGQFVSEEESFEEPDLKDAANRFAQWCNSISLRSIPAALITLVMAIATFSSEAGLALPFGLGHSLILATGTLMVCLLVVMTLCVDIIVRGAVSLIRGAPNAETLILFSCTFSLLSAAFTMLSGASAMLPYCAVSAMSLTFAAFGEKFNLRAITETLKTAAVSAEPYGLQAEYNEDIDKSVLKKAFNRTDGFYNNLMHPDISESAYRYATPFLLAAALILSVLTVLARGGGENFLHILSALLAAAAPFSLMLAFSVPFGIVAKSIRKSGAALAGWGGADDVCFTDGACVTDEDLFPPGTVRLTGMRLFNGISQEKAIRYTASLVMASESGMANVFSDLLKTQAMNRIRVEDFACYEGGVGALVRGERVGTGSAAFMNRLGVRVPDDTNMKNAVYMAVENRLAAMFTVDYKPNNSVQGALISILKWRIKLFFAVRDFNVTPLMLEQKFRVSLEGIEYIQARDSYNISDPNSGKQGRMAAVLTREGLGPFAEAVTGGRLLKSAALVATAVSVISAAFGVLLMFYMSWSGAFVSARPGNLLLFMLSMLAAVLIVCFYVKCKK